MSPRWRRLPKNRAECPSGLLLQEERSLVDPHVLDGYERAFQQQLEALIGRTKDPALRQAFEQMRDCPVQDRNGRCCRFSDYVVGALIRHGVHTQFDLEDALQRIMFWMLSPVGERGLPKKSLFDFDETRPYDLSVGNPFQAIFRKCLVNAVRTVAMGRIPALRRVQYPKRVSINYGRLRQRPGLRHHVSRRDSWSCSRLRFRDVERPPGFVAAAVHAGDATGRPLHVDPAR